MTKPINGTNTLSNIEYTFSCLSWSHRYSIIKIKWCIHIRNFEAFWAYSKHSLNVFCCIYYYVMMGLMEGMEWIISKYWLPIIVLIFIIKVDKEERFVKRSRKLTFKRVCFSWDLIGLGFLCLVGAKLWQKTSGRKLVNVFYKNIATHYDC